MTIETFEKTVIKLKQHQLEFYCSGCNSLVSETALPNVRFYREFTPENASEFFASENGNWVLIIKL